MPANHQRPAAQTPASPRNTAKYTNKDGSKFITVPKGTSESSQPSTPTSSKQADALPENSNQDTTTAPAVNRKKQKRRQKAAAKAAAEQAANGHKPATSVQEKFARTEPEHGDLAGSEEDEGYDDAPGSETVNGHSEESKGRKNKKKKKKGAADIAVPIHHSPVQNAASHIHSPLASHRGSGMSRDKIWSTSNQEERERIKEFWLGLGEDERKSLVKVEKDAVLRKMKEQQKHTCSCTVCGRKRTAIEEELEGLYDAYYVELEQFANSGGAPPLVSATRDFPFRGIHSAFPRKTPSRGRIVEHVGDDEGEDEDEELDEDYSDDGIDDDDYSDEEPPEEFHHHDRDVADFLTFGNSLQVKGGILTVADDLLKNDGKRFIEMMEQLAERRMAREEDARGHFSRGFGHPNGSYSNPHTNPPPDEDEFEEDDEDEEDYEDSQEDEYEDEEDPMTEEQRMEEGRRMFQIFAARMFEQRVLSAYKEKVAKERQAKLIEELEEEDRKEDEQKAKKAKNAQKKKEKAAQKKQAVAEEKARRDAEKAAEDAERLEAEQRKAEQQRQKAEEKKRQREAQKKAEEEARLRREAEKQRRLHDQRERQAEQERKAREAKERDRKLKEEQRLKEKEAREHREHETLERKEKQARDKREKEARAARAQKEAQEAKEAKERAREERVKDESLLSKGLAQSVQPSPPSAKRASQPPVPVPTVLPQHPANPASFASPKVPAVTPSLSKVAPIRSRTLSQQHHDHSQPVPAPSQSSSATSQTASPRPALNTSPIPIGQHRRESGSFSSNHLPDQAQATSPSHGPFGRPRMATPVQSLPPLGMQPPPGLGPHHVPPGFSNRLAHDPMVPPGFRAPAMIPPPGINGLGGRGFSPVPMPPPGFPQNHGEQFSPSPGFPLPHDIQPLTHPSHTHTRQGSAGFDAAPGTPTQPIARPQPIPQPIGRPNTTPQGKRGKDTDDEAERPLGSRALLDDDEDAAEPSMNVGSLRNQPPGPRPGGFGSNSFMDSGFGLAHNPWGPTAGGGNPFAPPGIPNPAWPTFSMASPPPPPPNRLSQASPSPSELRLILVQCYKDLWNAGQADPDGYMNFQQVKNHVHSQHRDLSISDPHIWKATVEVVGTHANGGGSFDARVIRGTPSLKWVAIEVPVAGQNPLANPLLGPTPLDAR